MKQTHSHLNEKSDLDAYDNEDHFEDEDYNIPDVNFDDLDLDDAEFGDAEFDDISNQTPELPSARADEQGALERHGDIQGPVTGDTSFILKTPRNVIDEEWRHLTVSVFEIPGRVIASDVFWSLSHKDQTPIDFLGLLPAELRNMVYGFLLEASSPIHLDTRLDRVMLASPHGRSIYSAPPSALRRLAIAQVNKQVSQEILPIVYGNNVFDFDKAGTLAAFLKQICSENAPDLKKLVISGRTPWNIDVSRLNFAGLSLATNLTSLKIDHRGLYAYALSDRAKINAGDLAEQLKAFLQTREAAKGDRVRRRSTSEVVELVEFPTCASCDKSWDGCWRASTCGELRTMKKVDEAHRSKMKKALDTAIAKKLV